MIHHVELVARIVAFARLGDPNAISVNGKARWTWCIEDAEKFLRLYPEILAQLTKTPSADHDDGNLRGAGSSPRDGFSDPAPSSVEER